MRKCQSKNPSACNVHGNGGQLVQLESKSLQAIQEGRAEDYFKIREEIDDLRDEISPDQKQSFFSRLFGGVREVEQSQVPKIANHLGVMSTPAPKPQAEPSVQSVPQSAQPAVEMVPCGKCNACDPPPSDITHFGRWADNECRTPVPKQ